MLNGIRVLDLTRVLAGPLCTMLLGDLGADVLKVERPEVGDDTRGWGPPFDARRESAYYLSVNRNKLGVAADLDLPADRELLTSLIAEADVVVDNFRPGVLERRGLVPERLMDRHPRLVWCTITGFGRDSERLGYDVVAQAECGWMAITGEPSGAPMKVGVALADVLTGKDAAIAILAALVARDRTGAGRRVYVSLADSARAALVNVAQSALVTGADARRWGNAHPNLVPYQLFETADRPIIVAVGNDPQWSALTLALGLRELHDDPVLAANEGRVVHRKLIVPAIQKRLLTDTAAAWCRLLEGVGVPAGVVKSVLDVVREIDASPLFGMPSPVGGRFRFPPPLLDEHGARVRERGWKAFE